MAEFPENGKRKPDARPGMGQMVPIPGQAVGTDLRGTKA